MEKQKIVKIGLKCFSVEHFIRKFSKVGYLIYGEKF